MLMKVDIAGYIGKLINRFIRKLLNMKNR
jgi:hypothetical protein